MLPCVRVTGRKGIDRENRIFVPCTQKEKSLSIRG